MSHINVDINVIIQLANYIDVYQGELNRLLQQMNNEFVHLQSKGHWNDDRYQLFYRTQWANLNDDMQYVFNVLDNDLKPFLSDYYQRLKSYQEIG